MDLVTRGPGAQSLGAAFKTAASVSPTKGTVAGVGIIFKEVRARVSCFDMGRFLAGCRLQDA